MQDATQAQVRASLARNLEDLAAWIRSSPVPLPIHPRLAAHVIDHRAARRTAEQLGMAPVLGTDPRSEYLTWERRFGQVKYVIQTTQPPEEAALVSGLERVLGRGLTPEERERALQDYRPSEDLPDGELYAYDGDAGYDRHEHDPSL